MPIYEYDCPKCGRFDAIQKTDDKPLKCNPDCSEKDCPRKAVRVMSPSAFHLKGSGWYKTDYSSGGGKKTSESESKSSSSSKSDSKKETPSGGGCGSGCKCH